MRAFRDASLKRKLTLITMVTSTVTLLLAGATYVTYDLVTFRRTMTHDLSMMAEIIGLTNEAALEFESHEDATKILSSLKLNRRLLSAVLYGPDGKMFARYDRSNDDAHSPSALGAILGWGGGYLEVAPPIIFDGRKIGTISIRSDLWDFYSRLERYVTMGIFVMLASLLVGFLLALRMKRAIAEPILHLADTAKTISFKKDFTVRATRYGKDEVGLLIDDFNEMVTQIQKRDEDLIEKGNQLEILTRHKSQFLANMSHELRTPMNAILGYTELIQDSIYGAVPAPIQEVLGRIEKSGRHLLGLINDVLDLSKIEAGHLRLSLSDGSMKEVVYTVMSSLESLATEKGLELAVNASPDLPPGRFDQRRITQVLLNLVGNAIKFTDAGKVTLSVTVSDGAYNVSVSDTGPGISQEDQGKIFQEFQQASASDAPRKGGTGLGLTIAKRIIEMHGGRIWVESTVGSGATFRFTLPVCSEIPVAIA